MIGIIRKVMPMVGEGKSLYLTFDDGPDPHSTLAVLDALAEKNAKATFFVVANTAKAHPEIFKKILSGGHAIGNHSLDHTYRRLFRGKSSLKTWVEDSEKILADLSGQATVGFRPPNGILTPELKWALRELQMPIVYWNIRFYDAIFSWTEKRAISSIKKTESGSIVLLHDRQSPAKLPKFLKTFSTYQLEIERAGFQCRALNLNLRESTQHNS
jgi:peptidoglycan/xylan/chitin deacetylase (PgdA/CDA1 family)